MKQAVTLLLAWNGLPGALIRWFLETVGNQGICQMLTGYEQLEATQGDPNFGNNFFTKR